MTDAFAPLQTLARVPGLRVSGSATAVWWDASGCYLALLHTKDSEGRYATLAYTFEGRPPFAIKNVSRPLPLQGGVRSFPSGLAIPPGESKVVVSYGVSDVSSRVLVMSNSYLHALFDWSADCSLAHRSTINLNQGGQEGGHALNSTVAIDHSMIGVAEAIKGCLIGRTACTRIDRALVAAALVLLATLMCILGGATRPWKCAAFPVKTLYKRLGCKRLGCKRLGSREPPA